MAEDRVSLANGQMAELLNRLVAKEEEQPERQEPRPVQISPDLGSSVQIFDGQGGSAVAKHWLESISSLGQLYGWTDDLMLSVARTKLSGTCLNWLYISSDKIRSWEEFRECFTDAFIGTESMSELYEALRRRVQFPGEPTVSYFFEKAKLCKQLNFKFSDLKEQILKGLRNQMLVAALVTRRDIWMRKNF